MFVFGVGNDVNSRLLDKLARGNFGISDYVLPQENIEEKISNLYSRISAPVLTDAKWSILRENDGNKNITNQVYPSGEFDLFAGEQLIIVGRYSKTGGVSVTLTGKVDNNEKTFTFDGDFVEKSDDTRFSFIERLWAVRRIGEIIDQLDLKGDNKELTEELVRLSTQHGILTPLTSFLADDSTDLHATTSNAARARELSRIQLGAIAGSGATSSRAMKSSMQNATFADESFARQGNAIAENSRDALYASPAADSAPSSSLQARRSGGSGFSDGGIGITPQTSRPGYEMEKERESAPSSFRAAPSTPQPMPQPMERVQQLANQTFYFRNNQWEDPSVTAEQRKKVQTVKQFSDEYFALIDKYGKELTQFLVLDEPMLLNFKGKTYLFEK
jgi:Ca-activated chloride channel family protein